MKTVGRPGAAKLRAPFEFEWFRPDRMGLVARGKFVTRRPIKYVFGSGLLTPDAPGDSFTGPWLVGTDQYTDTTPLTDVGILQDFLYCDLSDHGILQLASKHGFLGRFQCDILVRRYRARDSEGDPLLPPVMILPRNRFETDGVQSVRERPRHMVRGEPVSCWRNELIRMQALASVSISLRNFPAKDTKSMEQSHQALVLESFVGQAVNFETKYGGWQRSGKFSIPHKLGLPPNLQHYDLPPTYERSYAVNWAIQSGNLQPDEDGIPTSDIKHFPRIDALKLVAEYALIEQLNIALAEGSNYALLPEHLNTIRLAPMDLLGWLHLALADSIGRGKSPSFKQCEYCRGFFRFRANKKFCSYRCRDNARYARNTS